jgi:hypothetical protein
MIRPGDPEDPQTRDDPASPTHQLYPTGPRDAATERPSPDPSGKESANPIPLAPTDLAVQGNPAARRSG